MKYRTKRVQLRQKSLVALSLVSLVTVISVITVNAIQRTDQVMAQVKSNLALTPEASNQETETNSVTGLWVTGDSVILGIRFELETRAHISLINARVGRQAAELTEVMAHDKLRMLGSTVVFNLGNNNRLTQAQVAEIFDEVKDQPKIIVVNTAVPRSWRDENNLLIAQFAERYGAILIDWNAISQGHPEYFAPDGVHLVPTGVRAYVDAIGAQL